MGWLKRLFGKEKPEAKTSSKVASSSTASSSATTASTSTEEVPPERVGLNGEYDQSGLAKRVALAFDEEPGLEDEERLWVAQTGSTVVLKGEVAEQGTLDKMVSVAEGVNGCTKVDKSQVTVG